jgi:hypothetical protein
VKLNFKEIIKDSIRQYFAPLKAVYQSVVAEMKIQEEKSSKI